MKYYIIEESLAGVYPKVKCDTINEADIASKFSNYIGKVNPQSLNLHYTLKYHAKVTDVLTSLSCGNFNFLVSERFKQLLEEANLAGHIFFKASVMQKEKELRYYMLTLLTDEKVLGYIDYAKSKFRETEYGFKYVGPITINSYKHFRELFEAAANTIFDVTSEKLIMAEDFDRSLDMFTFKTFDRKVYISEKLKRKIEEANITGVEISGPVEF